MPGCHSLKDRKSHQTQSTVPKHDSTSGQSRLNLPIQLCKDVDILKPPRGKVDVFSAFKSNENEMLQKLKHPKISVKVRGEEFSLESQLFPMSPCTLIKSEWAEKMGLISYAMDDVQFFRKNKPLNCNVCAPIKFYYRNKFVFVPAFIDPDLSTGLLLGMDLLSYVEGLSSAKDFYEKKIPLGEESKENFGFELERPTRTQIDRFFDLCYKERYNPSKLVLYKEAAHDDILQVTTTFEEQLIAVVKKLEKLKNKISPPNSTPSSSS